MHPNPSFRKESEAKAIEYAQNRSFGILSINHDGGPLLSHIPFQLSQDGTYLEAHLVRSNPIARLLKNGAVDAVIAVSGGDSYISPDWYGVEDQVPTWNYIAIHLRGKLELLPDTELRGILDRLSENMETRLLPKKPWTIDKMTPEVFAKMSRQIVPIGMRIAEINSTFKLSQNKPEDARIGATKGVYDAGIGQEVNETAGFMEKVDPDQTIKWD